MMVLYENYLNGNDDNHEYVLEEAGKAAGCLSYQLLLDDKRESELGKSTQGCISGQEKKIMDNGVIALSVLFKHPVLLATAQHTKIVTA